MWKNKKWFAYILYSLLLCAALLYYRFPSEEAKDYLEGSFARAAPQFSLSIHRVSLDPGFRIKLEKIDVSRRLEPELFVFKAGSLFIRPRLRSFLRGKKVFCFEGTAYGGHLNGCAGGMAKRKEAPFSFSLQLEALRLETFDGLQRWLGRRVKGTLSGNISCTETTDSLLKGSGDAHLRLAKGEVELLQPVLGLRSVKFDKIEMRVSLKSGRAELVSAEMEGPDLKGSVTGTIILSKEILKSRLNLKGNVEPRRGFYQTISNNPLSSKFFKARAKRGRLYFSIRGILEKPSLQFI
ncbi:MAG: type II secretion system protein GspN [Deltaproteobacteria bacterium]|mgnify:CR=1 FL=1|nr:type II secretion system protein GspN [Deltaproteobacteria bacterium]